MWPWALLAVGVAVVVVVAAFLLAPGLRAGSDTASDGTPESVSVLPQDADEVEDYVSSVQPVAVVDLAGAVVEQVGPGADITSSHIGLESGALVVAVVEWADVVGERPAYPCWLLNDDPAALLQIDDTLEDYADWCRRDGDDWVRVDGLGIARVTDGHLVAVRAAWTGETPDRPTATADEVERAAEAIRFASDDESADLITREFDLSD